MCGTMEGSATQRDDQGKEGPRGRVWTPLGLEGPLFGSVHLSTWLLCGAPSQSDITGVTVGYSGLGYT